MTTPTDPLDDYLARLRTASTNLPPDVRQDLLDDVATHLEEIRRTSDSPTAVLDALDRLGSPEAIVRAAADETGLAPAQGPPAPPPVAHPGIGREVVTIGLTVFGVPLAALAFLWLPLLIPVAMAAAFIAGLALLWTSRRWTSGEKLLGTLVWPGGLGLPLFLATMVSQVCTTVEVVDSTGAEGAFEFEQTCTGFAFPPVVGIPLFLALLAAPIVVGALLLRRAQGRATGADATGSEGGDQRDAALSQG